MSSFLRRVERARLVARDRAEESLSLFLALPVVLHLERILVRRSWELRENLTSYDAPYVALAEALDAPFLTLDGALGRSVVRHTDVEVLGLSRR